MEKLPKGSSRIDHDHLDSALAEPFEVKGLNAAVGDDAIYGLQIADLAEAATAELRTVGQHDHFLGGVHHRPVERRFEHVGRRKAEFQIDAVHAHEQLAAIEVAEHLLGERPYDRHRTAAGDAAELNHVDVGVLRKDRSDGHRRR